MKGLMLAALLLTPAVISAQQYVEASGQTAVFTLAAGQTAPWDKDASPVVSPLASVENAAPTIRLLPDNRTFIIHAGTGTATRCLSVYSVSGRLMARATFAAGTGVASLKSPLASGYYFVKYSSAGKTTALPLFAAR